MTNYAGIWVDQRKATVATLQQDEEHLICVESDVEKHVPLAGGSPSRKTPYGPQEVAVDGRLDDRRKSQLRKYYQGIIRLVQDVSKVMIMGPGQAKIELKKEFEKTKNLGAKIIQVETVDKMTERQIVARVKHYFLEE